MNWFNFFVASIFAVNIFNGNLIANDDIDTADMGSESIKGPYSQPADRSSPFSFSSYVDAMGKAKINKGYFEGDKFQFAIANAEVQGVFYYSPCYSEAASVTLGYTETYFGWKDNYWFDQSHFHTVNLSLGAQTKRFDDWFWRTQIDINYDGFEEFDAQYFNYNLILWGRYSICRAIGIHMGFYLETGMRMDRIYPIIGFDWQMSRKWKLNAVFPFDMSLQYLMTDNWTFALAGRTFSSRHRTEADGRHPKFVTRYSNFGIEAMIKYAYKDFAANIHAGVTTGGDLKIANASNHHPHHYHLDSTGYMGAEVDMRF